MQLTVTQLSNYLNMIVQQHAAQTFSYPSLQYYIYGTLPEGQASARQNNSNPKGSKGRQYPFLLCSYIDASLNAVAQGPKIGYDFDLYLHDLQFYGTNGTNNQRSIIEIQRDLIAIALDIVSALNEIGRSNGFQVSQAGFGTYTNTELASNANVEKVCILKIPMRIDATLNCSEFVFDANALPVSLPYPAETNDYEKIIP